MPIALFDLDQTLLPYDTQALFCNYVLRRQGWRRMYLAAFLPVAPLRAAGAVSTRTLKRVFLSYLRRMPPDLPPIPIFRRRRIGRLQMSWLTIQ